MQEYGWKEILLTNFVKLKIILKILRNNLEFFLSLKYSI